MAPNLTKNDLPTLFFWRKVLPFMFLLFCFAGPCKAQKNKVIKLQSWIHIVFLRRSGEIWSGADCCYKDLRLKLCRKHACQLFGWEQPVYTNMCILYLWIWFQLRTHECAVAARQFKPFPHHGALKRNSGNHFGWGNHSQFSRRCCKWHDWPPEGKYGSCPFDSFRWSCVS